MCPDDVILSAYFDGELEGDTGKTVEHHVRECDRCRAKVSSYKQVGHILHKDDALPLLRNKEYIKTRVFEYNSIKNRRRFWKQGIMLPIPLAATMVAFICFLIGGITFFSIGKNTPSYVTEHAQSKAIEIQAEELALLQKLLESENVVVEVNMQIPEQKEIKIIGEPQILTQEQRIDFSKYK